jgi:pyruvate,water dikinase
LDFTRPLADITLTDVEQVGGKAAHLGAMLRAGFSVPCGFVITVDAFTDHFGPTTDPLVKPPAPRIRPELMAEVVEAIREHLGDEPEFAVRSSSTAEDAAEASFAGQHATYYFIPPSRIDQAIIDCWMSLWSDAALAYRRSGIAEISSGEPVRMAVIVQRMVRATRSGIAFSRDPIDAANTDCVIEATWGLGACLVDGRVNPDHVRVTEAGELKSYQVNEKQFLVTPNPSNPDARRLDEVPRDQAREPALTTDEAERIANIASQLETLFEGPQDVEWAFAGEELSVLQSRPITTRAVEHEGLEGPYVIFKPLVENFTEPLTPLSADLYARVLPRFGKIIDGRFYLDADKIRAVVPYKMSDAEFVDLALLRRMPDTLTLDWPKALRLVLSCGLVSLVDGATWLRTLWVKESGLAKFKKLAQIVQQSDRHDALEALRRLFLGHHPLEPIGHHMVMVNITAGRYFFFLGLLRKFIKTFAPDYSDAQLNKTFHGQQQMHSVALVQAIGLLADLLADTRANDPDGAEQIEAVIRGETPFLPSGHPFTIAVEQFLETYGHRCSREMELAAPRWRESVQPFLAMVAGHSVTPGNRTHGAYLAARDELHQSLRPWQRRIADRLIARIAKDIALRENSRHYHIMGFSVVRYKLLELEQQLLYTDQLKVAGDIFFLRYDEVIALEAGTLNPTDAHRTIRRRRRRWARAVRTPVAETINIELDTRADEASTEDALTGQCASPGRAEGLARVAHSLQEAAALNPGEILVAPYTDPSWTALFPRAAGVVVAMGSYLSHAGTIARELHVPCLVDVAHCTELITTGQRVRLDADAGKIEVLE